MHSTVAETKNWFDQGGSAYARYRPEYPPAVAAFLASIAPDTVQALDVGCGSGQFTVQLAEHFRRVSGIDPSEDQINHATPKKNVTYHCAPAEDLPLPNHSASLVTAAQAAHWFDLPRFYGEVRRVATQDAILALISYGVLRLEGDLGARFERFYWHEIGPYWPPERQLVDSGYATIEFPFNEIGSSPIAIHLEWSLEDLLGYISTWSSVRNARDSGRDELLQGFAADIANLWGEHTARRPITWPVSMRVGRL